MQFKVAGLFWRPALYILNASAITMPWRRVYMRPDCFDDVVLRRHELVHIEQIDRDGPVLFCLKYGWWLLRYGYWNNPYEVEAYEREGPASPTIDASKRRT